MTSLPTSHKGRPITPSKMPRWRPLRKTAPIEDTPCESRTMHRRTTSARMTIDQSRPCRLPLLGVFSLLILLCMPPRAGQSQDAVPQLGTLDIQLTNTDLVPGSLLDVRYQTSPGTVQGPVDIYFAISCPPEQTLLFFQE